MKRFFWRYLLLYSIVFLANETSNEKPFVIIIPSFNNEQWCEKNLLSALNQNYNNFRIIYINDASTDKNLEIVLKLINEHDTQNRITLIANRIRKGALANYYYAIHMCEPQEIMITLDGDDWLSNNNVLSYLNAIYQNSDVWITYGQFIEYPGNYRGSARELPQNIITQQAYRQYDWVTTHLRTFYAGLFHKISKNDFMHEGKFYEMTWDLAIMYPMLEMAGIHSKFISEILYVYNRATPLNDNKVNVGLQQYYWSFIRAKSKYQVIEKLFDI